MSGLEKQQEGVCPGLLRMMGGNMCGRKFVHDSGMYAFTYDIVHILKSTHNICVFQV